MTYYLVNYRMNGDTEVLRTFGYYTSLRDAYAMIRDMQAEDVKHGDAGDWLYNVEVVETVAEYPVPREPEKGEAHD